MNDDFNTALAIAHLFEGVRTINRLSATKKFTKKPDLVAQVKDLHATIIELGSVLGILGSQPQEWLEKVKLAGLAGLDITREEIEQLIEERLDARQNKDFERGDQIRAELEERGIELLDSREGTSWKLK
jgi:cysteinyl-tRNA synthetase